MYVCTNGVFAGILNGLISPEIKISVKVPAIPTMSIMECFNSKAENLFTFMDPISKLSFKGHIVKFNDAAVYDGLLVTVIITDSPGSAWLPPASMLFLMGWGYFEHGDLQIKAQEALRRAGKLTHLC
jgi:hypothetical protein